MGLGTWFQPSVDVQRKGATDEQLGDDPVIERGDVLHCDVGITALRLNTDIQHLAYVLREGETRRAGGTEAGAGPLQSDPGHPHGGDPAGPHAATRSSLGLARRHARPKESTARSTRTRSDCTATAPGR